RLTAMGVRVPLLAPAKSAGWPVPPSLGFPLRFLDQSKTLCLAKDVGCRQHMNLAELDADAPFRALARSASAACTNFRLEARRPAWREAASSAIGNHAWSASPP